MVTEKFSIQFPRIHITFIFLISIIFIGFLFVPGRTFKAHDPIPEIIKPSSEVIDQLKKNKRLVHTHLSITDNPQLDILNDKFKLFGRVFFTYDPKSVSRELIGRFDIKKGELIKEDVIYIPQEGGLESAHYKIKINSILDLDYHTYPVDDHTIAFALVNEFAKNNELFYVAENSDFHIDKDIAMSRWREISKEVDTGFLQQFFLFGELQYPAILYKINYVYCAMREAGIILLPLFLLFFLSMLMLSLNPETKHELMIKECSASIVGLMAYLYVIQLISPRVSYFMLSDYLFFLFLLTIFINLVLVIFIKRIPARWLKYIIIGLYLWVLAFCVYFLLGWAW